MDNPYGASAPYSWVYWIGSTARPFAQVDVGRTIVFEDITPPENQVGLYAAHGNVFTIAEVVDGVARLSGKFGNITGGPFYCRGDGHAPSDHALLAAARRDRGLHGR